MTQWSDDRWLKWTCQINKSYYILIQGLTEETHFQRKVQIYVIEMTNGQNSEKTFDIHLILLKGDIRNISRINIFFIKKNMRQFTASKQAVLCFSVWSQIYRGMSSKFDTQASYYNFINAHMISFSFL